MAQFALIFRGGVAHNDTKLSPQQMQQHMQKWMTWFEGMTRDGVYAGKGAPLALGGKVVRAPKTVSDGPYAEAKDLVGGFAVVEAKDLDAAVEIARGCPTYEASGTVEVRPVQAM